MESAALHGDINGDVLRVDFISHSRATIVYLEVNREQIKATRGWRWPFSRAPTEPIDAEFKEVTESPEQPTKKAGKSVRLIKGGD